MATKSRGQHCQHRVQQYPVGGLVCGVDPGLIYYHEGEVRGWEPHTGYRGVGHHKAICFFPIRG